MTTGLQVAYLRPLETQVSYKWICKHYKPIKSGGFYYFIGACQKRVFVLLFLQFETYCFFVGL